MTIRPLLGALVLAAALAGTGLLAQSVVSVGDAAAQTAAQPKKKPKPAAEPAPVARDRTVLPPARGPASEAATAAAGAQLPPERVEADVSTRTIAITSGYSGSEILIFGAIENSRQPSAESGFYDVVVVVEGAPAPLTVRRKSRIAGVWVNTRSFSFNSVPSYYAIASTRPIEEIADPTFLERNAIGHGYARIAPAARSVIAAKPGEIRDYKEAVVRIKQGDGLYLKEDYAVIFIGKSLFRASIALPANVPVGPMTARVYLFREGDLLSTFQSKVRLERSGIELWLYRAAMHHPLYYGLSAVLVATLAGWLASLPFRRRPPA